jgi:hypothetical protein
MYDWSIIINKRLHYGVRWLSKQPIFKWKVTLWNEMIGLTIIDLEVTMRNQLYVFYFHDHCLFIINFVHDRYA